MLNCFTLERISKYVQLVQRVNLFSDETGCADSLFLLLAPDKMNQHFDWFS